MSKYGHDAISVGRTQQISCDICNKWRAVKIFKSVLEIKMEELVFFTCVINLLNNKTVIVLNRAEYRLILANSAYGLVG